MVCARKRRPKPLLSPRAAPLFRPPRSLEKLPRPFARDAKRPAEIRQRRAAADGILDGISAFVMTRFPETAPDRFIHRPDGLVLGSS